MPIITLELSDEQIVQLFEQLPPERQNEVYKRLLRQQWSTWVDASQSAENSARRLAKERGLDWDSMNDAERLNFVDDLIHEGRSLR